MQVNYGAVKEPQIAFCPRHYLCSRATGPLILDGRLDKPFWEKAEWTEDFVDIEGDIRPKPAKRTRAKMLWDEEFLYIGAELMEDRIFATVAERDAVIFVDNDFEVFIDPDGDTHLYYEFEMNALNTLWDLMLAKPYRDGAPAINSWDIRGIKTAVYIDGEINNPSVESKRWSVEIAMPWSVLKDCAKEQRPPRAGEYWRIDFSRVEWKTNIVDGKIVRQINPETGRPYPEDNWVWAPTGIVDMHCPEMWGFLVFTDGETSFEIPRDEEIKWELRKLYYRERNYFAENGCFTADLALLMKGDEWTIDPKAEITSALFQLTAPDADGTGKWLIAQDGWIGRI